MKNLGFIIALLFMLMGCQKDVTEVVEESTKFNAGKHKSSSCSFYKQGVKSLAQFDELVASNASPLNLLTTDAKAAFRSSLIFAEEYGNIVVGYGRGSAYMQLTGLQYVELIQLVVGINPQGDSYPEYTPKESLPTYKQLIHNMTPCYRKYTGCKCEVSWNNECVFMRTEDIATNCD